MTTLKQILFFSFCFLASTITMRGGNYITSLELVEQYTPCGDLNGHRLRVKGFLPSSSHKIDNIFISGISTEYTINVVNTGEIGTTALVPFDTLLGNIHSNTTVNYAIDGVAIEHEVKEYAPTSLPVTSSSCISSPSTISGC